MYANRIPLVYILYTKKSQHKDLYQLPHRSHTPVDNLILTATSLSSLVCEFPTFKLAEITIDSKTVNLGWSKSSCMIYLDNFLNKLISLGSPFVKIVPLAPAFLKKTKEIN